MTHLLLSHLEVPLFFNQNHQTQPPAPVKPLLIIFSITDTNSNLATIITIEPTSTTTPTNLSATTTTSHNPPVTSWYFNDA
jgi:hypothetical protein